MGPPQLVHLLALVLVRSLTPLRGHRRGPLPLFLPDHHWLLSCCCCWFRLDYRWLLYCSHILPILCILGGLRPSCCHCLGGGLRLCHGSGSGWGILLLLKLLARRVFDGSLVLFLFRLRGLRHRGQFRRQGHHRLGRDSSARDGRAG